MPTPAQMRRRSHAASTVALCLMAFVSGACGTRDNPDTCNSPTEPCPANKTCDVSRHLCVYMDAMADGPGAGDASTDAFASPRDGGLQIFRDAGAPDSAVDAAVPPDAANTCSQDSHCTQPGMPYCVRGACAACAVAIMEDPKACEKRDPKTPVCAPSGKCVECVAHATCPVERPLCEQNACTACARATTVTCAALGKMTPACEAASGKCVECTMHKDCSTDAKPVCAPTGNTCVACTAGGAGACAIKDPLHPACDPSGRCVECVTSADCRDTGKPICTANACVPCSTDAQCSAKLGANPGVCADDGHCAQDADVLYVKYTAGGCPGAGSLAAPFCSPQSAADVLSTQKRIMVIRGPVAGFRLTSAVAGRVTIVGQENASIAPPSDGTGISISAGDVSIRSLRVSGGDMPVGDGIRVSGAGSKLALLSVSVTGNNGIGVQADGGAELRMNRCLIESNAGGGIKTDNAGFDVANTAVAGNSQAGLVGGVSLGTTPAAGPRRFANNTIVNNKNVAGLVCTGGTSHTVTGLIVYGNTGLQVSSCSYAACCTGDPLLSASYRLMSGSPCLDKLAPGDAPSDDIDGDSRPLPQGARSDCGADELKP